MENEITPEYEEKLLENTKKLGEIVEILFERDDALNVLANTLANICAFSDDPKMSFFEVAKKFFILSKKYDSPEK